MAARQNITNLILIAGALGAAVFVLATREKTTTDDQKAREHNLVQVFRPDALTEIVVERDGVKFRLFRGTADADAGPDVRAWKIEQDGKVDTADAFAVDRATGNLDHAYYERLIKPEEVNRPQFGLDAPRLKATMVMGSLRTTFALGGPALRPDNAIYVDDNGAVKVTKKSGVDFVDVAPEGFRSRTIVPYLSTDLRQMRLAHEGHDVTLEKLAGLSWKLASGDLAGTRVERFALDRILNTFADLKADHFLSEADARQAQQGAPTVRVTMVHADAGKPSGEFTVGGPCPGHPDEVVVVRTAPKPLFACSGKGNVEALARSAEQLGDPRVFSLREDEIEEATLEQGDKKLEIARKGNNWRQRLPVEADVAAEQAKALVKALGTTRGDRLTRQAPAGFEPAAKVTIHGPRENEEARPPETVELGKPAPDGSVLVRRQQDGALVRLDRDQARPFFPRTTALRSTRLIEHSIDRARKIRVYEGANLLQSLERKAEGNWALAAPRGYAVDIGVVSDLAENLLHLSADQWVADRDDGSFGLEKPRLRAELEIDEGGDAGAKSYRLALGEVGPSGSYGRLEGVDGVFIVPRSLETTLTSLAIDLSVFMLNVDDIDRVTFKRPEGTLALQGKSGALRPLDGAPELPPSRLEAIKSAVSEMRAQSVVHLGGPRKEEGLDRPALEITVKRRSDGKELKLTFGASDVLRNASVHYARADGVDATYAIAAARVRALLAQL